MRIFGVVLVVLATCLGITTSASAAPSRTLSLAPTSGRHPYSDPLYFPVHAGFRLDCVRNNPGCKGPHKYWMMDIVPTGQLTHTGKPSHAKVYAMGAGILHVGDARGAKCPARSGSLGTWVWIDHGAGTLSRYGHFSTILVKDGSRVAAGQAIGVVGTTGKGANCQINYTNFMVEHNGLQEAHAVQMKSHRVCLGSSTRAAAWPAARTPRYKTWNEVPQGTEFPASTGQCLPTSAPKTATAPRSTTLRRSGSGQLTARWTKPSAGYHVTQVMVELSLYHPSTRTWDRPNYERYVLVSPTRTSYEFSKLTKHRTYRIRVSLHNAVGWNYATAWHAAVVA